MNSQERDYLRQQIKELGRSKGRWKLATLTLVAALAIFLIVGGLSDREGVHSPGLAGTCGGSRMIWPDA
jgi:hypothetical protein